MSQLRVSYRNMPISAMNQLLLTLQLFATGSYYISVGDFAGVSTTSAHRIACRVTNAIARLLPHYVKFHSTTRDIQREQARFYSIAAFSKVVGCLDCTHVRIQSYSKYHVFFKDISYILFSSVQKSRIIQQSFMEYNPI